MSSHELKGLSALVTGAGSGLGRATALALSRAGVRVAISSRQLSKVEETAALMENGTVALTAACDLADGDSIQRLVAQVKEVQPSLDILVNNGSPWLLGAFEELEPAQIESTIQAAVAGTLLLTHGLLPLLKQGDQPHLLNVISVSGAPTLSARPNTSSVPFIAAKFGQHGMNEALREELRPHGIRVTGLYPGLIEVRSKLDDPVTLGGSGHGRMMSNPEVVEVVLFCLSRRVNLNMDTVVITSPFSEYAR